MIVAANPILSISLQNNLIISIMPAPFILRIAISLVRFTSVH